VGKAELKNLDVRGPLCTSTAMCAVGLCMGLGWSGASHVAAGPGKVQSSTTALPLGCPGSQTSREQMCRSLPSLHRGRLQIKEPEVIQGFPSA